MPDELPRDPVRRLEAVVAEARAQAARARVTIEQAHQALDRSRHTVIKSRRFVKAVRTGKRLKDSARTPAS
jgi:hypothetical protein